MSIDEIKGASTLKLLMHVFGKQTPAQTLNEFSAECGSVKADTAFIAEVREYAIKMVA